MGVRKLAIDRGASAQSTADFVHGSFEVLHLTFRFNKNQGGIGKPARGRQQHTKMLRRGTDGDVVKIVLPQRARQTARLIAVATVLAGAGGCGLPSLTSGIGGGVFSGGNASKDDAKPLTQERMLTAAKADGPSPVGGDVATGCPRFQVWPRDHHVTIYEPGRAGDGLAVMHRGEITQTARECSIEGNRVSVKYGFSGRVLLGPRGRTGSVTLPVRVFVTDSKRERIVTDTVSVEVVVSADKPIGYFSAVRTVSFPIAEGARAGEYEVYVGFDQKAPGAG
jgi:hypothetical protein